MDSYAVALDEEFLQRLRQFVQSRMPSGEDADDVVQDALVKLLRKGDAVPVTSVRAWLFTVARHEIIDRWRARRGPEHLSADEPPEPDESAEAVAYLSRCLAPMLEAMQTEDRDLLQRVDVLGESQADVARSQGLPLSTVKSRVQRARARLRRTLERCCAVERDGRGTPIDYARRPDRPSPCGPTDRSA